MKFLIDHVRVAMRFAEGEVEFNGNGAAPDIEHPPDA